tara:strand:- start:172 stop:1050 length:879 start_codon:yes stop_codon:yes gene_type:complete
MLILIGYLITIGSVFGGFVLAGGHLFALFQPLEFLMIGGAALGAFLVGNNASVIKNTLRMTYTTIISFGYNRKYYRELLSLMYELTEKIKKDGPLSIEEDIESVDNSQIFLRYPLLKKDTEIVAFLRDYLRIIITGRVSPHQLEQLMDEDIETFMNEKEQPIHAINRVADALPAFGIVAAVMGIIHTMESMGGPPEQLGALIAKALVGTFLGVLIGYGFVAPIAMLLESKVNASVKALTAIKTILLASVNNLSPTIAVEFGRKTIHSIERPDGEELESILKDIKQGGKAANE